MQAQENIISVEGYNVVIYTYGSGDNTISLNGGPGQPCDYL